MKRQDKFGRVMVVMMFFSLLFWIALTAFIYRACK